MDGLCPALEKLLGLCGTPLHTNAVDLAVVLAFDNFFHQILRNIDGECLRQQLYMLLCGNRFEARDDREDRTSPEIRVSQTIRNERKKTEIDLQKKGREYVYDEGSSAFEKE